MVHHKFHILNEICTDDYDLKKINNVMTLFYATDDAEDE